MVLSSPRIQSDAPAALFGPRGEQLVDLERKRAYEALLPFPHRKLCIACNNIWATHVTGRCDDCRAIYEAAVERADRLAWGD